MRLGNTTLVQHGIYEEEADLRIHISVVTKGAYVFQPKYAIKAIKTGMYEKVSVYTGYINTAEGYLIPPEEIHGCRRVDIPNDIFHDAHFNNRDNTSEKGRKAEIVARKMMHQNLIPLLLDTVPMEDIDLQRAGYDILPIYSGPPQVKCDWKAGSKELGGTGYLFIQTAECNPLKRY